MRAWRQADRIRIGVVVHGPEIIDSGAALRLINYLKKFGSVTAILGGTMGRLAVIDAGLDNVIAISPKRRPSESLRGLRAGSDILILVNQAKTRETGLAFGSKVADNAKVSKPLIQIDCGGKFIAILAGGVANIAERLSKDLGFGLIDIAKVQNGSTTHEGNVTKRRLTGVMPGELITVNGIVIAKAIDNSVEIEASNKRIIKVIGAEMKLHGIEKLPSLDLESAIVRSGNIRRTEARLGKALKCEGNWAVLINHNAEDAFEISKDACIAVTVGDDTTAIAREILSRLSIPIIGIIDGDLDGLSGNIAINSTRSVADSSTNNTVNSAIQNGSIIFRVEPGYDDVIGVRVKEQIFKGVDRVQIKTSELLDKIMWVAGSHIMTIERY